MRGPIYADNGQKPAHEPSHGENAKRGESERKSVPWDGWDGFVQGSRKVAGGCRAVWLFMSVSGHWVIADGSLRHERKTWPEWVGREWVVFVVKMKAWYGWYGRPI